MKGDNMNNKSKMTEISAKPAKEKKLGWQKIAIIVAAVLLVAGLGTFVAIELINRNNNSRSEEIVETTADTENYFESAPKYTLELKDGENKITEPGVYTITGSSNGYIHVNTGDSKVKLILSGVTIKNSSGAAIYVESNGNVHIETVGENNLSVTATEDIDAAIYSKADLVFKGDGTLNIESSIDGIHGKDDVKIKSGTINVTATEDGIKGKDSLTIEGGDITVSAGDDGLKASNDEEEDKGILTISGGNVIVKKSSEAIEAAQINITGGNIDVTSTDDGINAAADFCSQKAMAPTGDPNITVCKISISGGTIKVTAGGDGLDANGSIYTSGGTIEINSPTSFGDSAIDYDGVFENTGATITTNDTSGSAGQNMNQNMGPGGQAQPQGAPSEQAQPQMRRMRN